MHDVLWKLSKQFVRNSTGIFTTKEIRRNVDLIRTLVHMCDDSGKNLLRTKTVYLQ